MVKNSGTEICTSQIKYLNVFKPISIKENSLGFPDHIIINNQMLYVSLEDRWRIDDEWWRLNPISRMYFDCILIDGSHLTIFKDLINGGWFQQRYR